MRLAAHAKINLTLAVLGTRPDGYHDLRSIVVPIPLHDDVELFPADDLSVEMTAEGAGTPEPLPQERNLAWKAARALQRATGCVRGARIVILKRIPAGAGLGGGSADAAAVLNGLNALWELALPPARLADIGAMVGSDVPALVLGGAVLMEGRGERVTPLRDFAMPDFSRFVLRVPSVTVSTPSVYRAFRPSDRGRGRNDLQPAACRLHPEIGIALETLRREGCTDVQMSGSGGAVFGWRKEGGATR